MDSVKTGLIRTAAAVGLGVVFAATTAAPVAFAASGSVRGQGAADPISVQTMQGCEDFVRDAGYPVGAGVTHACETGAAGNYAACVGQLEMLHVYILTADFACYIAYH